MCDFYILHFYANITYFVDTAEGSKCQNNMSGFNYSGFQMKGRGSGGGSHNAVPPPPSTGISKQGYSTMNAISQNALSAAWGGSRKRAVTEDELVEQFTDPSLNCFFLLVLDVCRRYFEEDDEDATPALAYIPAPGSPTRLEMEKKRKQQENEEDDDPLDAYMAGIEKQVSS